jgi:membrane protein YqaA with SNARE-associated domain
MVELLGLLYQYGLIGLFAANALSDSVIPVPSWPLIILATGFYPAAAVFAFSVAGSMLGAITNYIIGLKGIRGLFIWRSPRLEKRARAWFTRWGAITLLGLTWMPWIGDPITIVAGTLRMPFKKYVLYILAAKIWTVAVIILFGQWLLAIAGWP